MYDDRPCSVYWIDPAMTDVWNGRDLGHVLGDFEPPQMVG